MPTEPAPTMTETPTRWWPRLGVVVLLAGVVRLASLFFDSQLPLFRYLPLDSELYDTAGKAIAEGDWKLGSEVLHMSPAYSYFVGLVYWIAGPGPWPIRLVQLLLGLVTVAAIGDAARRLWGERWGLAAGLCAALYGPFIFYDSILLADGLATCLNALFVWSVLIARESKPRTWLGVGLIWGLAIVTRPNAILLAVPLALATLWRTDSMRRRVQSLALATFTAALVVAPVTLRNLLVAGEPVLVTDSGGLNLYIGNGPHSVGTFHAPPEVPEALNPRNQFPMFREAAAKAVGHPVTAREADAYWMKKTVGYVSTHRGWWLRLMGEKLWLYWSAREIPNTEDYSFTRELNPILAAPLVQFGWLAPLALLGTLVMLWRRREEERFVALFNVVLCAANVIVFILAHYRIASVPGLMLAAIGCVHWGVEAWRAKRVPSLAMAAVALVPVLVLVWTPKLPRPFDSRYFKLGFAYYSLGDVPGAVGAYEQALTINPNHLSAHKNLGVLYEQLQQPQLARQHWQEVARLAPGAGKPEYAKDARDHLDALAQQGF